MNLSQECGPGMECSSGGCCPIPFCPTGIQVLFDMKFLLFPKINSVLHHLSFYLIFDYFISISPFQSLKNFYC